MREVSISYLYRSSPRATMNVEVTRDPEQDFAAIKFTIPGHNLGLSYQVMTRAAIECLADTLNQVLEDWE